MDKAVVDRRKLYPAEVVSSAAVKNFSAPRARGQRGALTANALGGLPDRSSHVGARCAKALANAPRPSPCAKRPAASPRTRELREREREGGASGSAVKTAGASESAVKTAGASESAVKTAGRRRRQRGEDGRYFGCVEIATDYYTWVAPLRSRSTFTW